MNDTPSHRSLPMAFAIVVWLLAAVVVVLGLKDWMPPLASEHGAGIDSMLRYSLFCVGVLIAGGHAVLGCFLWRFGRRALPTDVRVDFARERRWSLIPVVILAVVAEGGVLVIGLPVWGKVYGDAPANALVIEVTGEQFAWNVRYPGPDGKFGRTDPKRITLDNPLGMDPGDLAGRDDITGLNEIRVPHRRPVKIRLRSKDVLHSFFLPHLRVKQDAVPGMTIELWFVPTEKGSYELACAELCGFGHYEMGGALVVTGEEEFQKWLEEKKNG